MFYRFYLLGAFFLFFYQCRCQSLIEGRLKFDYDLGRYYPIKIILSNGTKADTAIIDSTFRFRFRNIAIGKYKLQTATDYGVTGLKNVIVTDIVVNRDSIKLPEITLFQGMTCDGGAFVFGRKNRKEFYKNGELYAKGNYKIKKRYYLSAKTFELSYQKQGTWYYFYRSGHLLRQAVYLNDQLISFKDFYENKHIKLIGYYGACKINKWKYFAKNGQTIFVVDFKTPFLIAIDSRFLSGFMKYYPVLDDLW
jgi:hypothetical protein